MINIKYKDLIDNGIEHGISREVIGVLLIVKVTFSSARFQTFIHEEDVEIRVYDTDIGTTEVFLKAKIKRDIVKVVTYEPSFNEIYRGCHKKLIEESGDTLTEKEEEIYNYVKDKYPNETDITVKAIKLDMSKDRISYVSIFIKRKTV